MGEVLSLSSAAKFAGVTQVTMRTWVSKIEGVERDERGGYKIPEQSLRVFLLRKSERKVQGATTAVASVNLGSTAGDEIIGLLKDQLLGKDRELVELRQELREAQTEIRRLNAELQAYLSGGTLGGVSRWIKSKLV
jgi:hypothetical protein